MKIILFRNNIPFFVTVFLLLSLNYSSSAQKAGKERLAGKIDNGSGEYYFTEGMKYYILEDYEKAKVNFNRVNDINPKNAANHYIIGEILQKQKKFSEALFHALKAVELEDENKYYYISLAQVYENLQRYKEAVEVYQRLLKKFPEAFDVYFDLANDYLYLSKYKEAIECYNKIEEVFGVNEDVVRQKQHLYLKQNNLNSALLEGEKLIKLYPEEAIYKINQAELLISNNRTNDGQQLLESVVKENPEEPYSRIMLYEIYKDKTDLNKAEENLLIAFRNPELDMTTKVKILVDYMQKIQDPNVKATAMKLGEAFLQAHPNDPTSYTIYADLLRSDSQKKEALKYYVKASKLDESNFNVWQWLVSMNLDLNNIDSAIHYSDKALELFPNQPEFWYFSGVGYFMKKSFKRSSEMLEQAKSLALNNQALVNQINGILGDVYNSLKEYRKSDNAYEEALKINPNDEHVMNNYSYYLSLRKEKLTFAKEMSSKLVKNHPENATYLDTYGWVLYMMEDFDEALKYIQKAAKLSPGNGAILEHYGDVLFKLGQKEKALEQWKKAKVAGETSSFIDKKITDQVLYE